MTLTIYANRRADAALSKTAIEPDARCDPCALIDKSGSHMTRRWREQDSNHRSRVRGVSASQRELGFPPSWGCRWILSSDPAQALLLKPHAGPAVAGIARIEENNAGMVERFLNCNERAGTRIGPTALQVFYSDFGETRRFSQRGLRPIEEPTSCTDLSGRDHSYTIVEYVRNDNFGLPCVSSSLHSFVCHNAPKGYSHCLIYLIDDQRYSWHVCPGGASAGAVAQRSPPRT